MFNFLRYLKKRIPVWFEMMLFENGKLSMSNFFYFCLISSFIIGSFYLLLTHSRFEYYSEFATFTAGGGVLGKVGNKYINATKNSPPGEPPNLYIPKEK